MTTTSTAAHRTTTAADRASTYRCPRCGTGYTLNASWAHDQTSCVEWEWLAAEGFRPYGDVQVGDLDQHGRTVTAVKFSKSGKRVFIHLDGVAPRRGDDPTHQAIFTRP